MCIVYFVDLSVESSVRSVPGMMRSNPAHSKANIRGSYPPGQSQHNLANQQLPHGSQTQSAHPHSKHLNTNHSAKPSNVTTQKGNQINKKPPPTNTKHNNTAYTSHHQKSIKPGSKVASTKAASGPGKTADGKNGTKSSLAEDVPRRELGMLAAPQE